MIETNNGQSTYIEKLKIKKLKIEIRQITLLNCTGFLQPRLKKSLKHSQMPMQWLHGCHLMDLYVKFIIWT